MTEKIDPDLTGEFMECMIADRAEMPKNNTLYMNRTFHRTVTALLEGKSPDVVADSHECALQAVSFLEEL